MGFKCKVNIDIDDLSKPGTAVLWRASIPISDVVNVCKCRAQILVLNQYAVMNVYAPSGSEKKNDRAVFFSREVFRGFQIYPNSVWLFCGDFNCILSPLDVEEGTGYAQKNCPQLSQLVDIMDFQDVFRFVYPRKREYTFHRPHVASSRLDRMYISRILLPKATKIEHVASISDHNGVKLDILLNISLVHQERIFKRKTYWKLNSSILHDEDFMSSFVTFWLWVQSLKSDFKDDADWWDLAAKPYIKQFCIEFSKNRRKIRSDTKNFLFSYLKVVLDAKNWEEVVRVRERLKSMLDEDTYGYVVRSRFGNNASNEVASIFHANLEQKNGKKNSLKQLKVNGKVEEDRDIVEN